MPLFNNDAQRRISRVVRNIEKAPANKPPDFVPPQVTWFGKIAITTSTITAGGSGALGKGTAQLQVITRDDDGNATYDAMSYDDITVYNLANASISSGKTVQLKVVDGCWLVDWEQC